MNTVFKRIRQRFPLLCLMLIGEAICLFHIRDCAANIGQWSVFLPLMVLSALMLLVILLCKDDPKASLWLPMGLLAFWTILYMVSMPSVIVPDEMEHMKRVGLISQGNLAASQLYAPTNYLPQVLGYKIASLFTDQYDVLLMAGRTVNMLVSVSMLILALCIAPYGKSVLFSLTMLPVALQEGMSLSPDATTFAMAVLLMAFVLRLHDRGTQPFRRELILLAVLCALLSVCKVIYVACVGIVLLVPFPGKKKQGILYKSLLIVGCLVFDLAWMIYSSFSLQAGAPTAGGQVSFVLHNMLSYISIVIRSIFHDGMYWVESAAGQYIGSMNIFTTGPLWWCFTLLLTMAVFSSNVPDRLKRWEKIWLLMIFICGCLLVITSLYLEWTPVMNDLVVGVQGRYFTPFLPMVLIVLAGFRNKVLSEDTVRKLPAMPGAYTLAAMVLLHTMELADIIHGYYFYYGG